MTKAQKKARAKRAGAKLRKSRAATAFLRKMNPAMKKVEGIRVRRLKGGGYTVTPIKPNRGKRRAKKASAKKRRR